MPVIAISSQLGSEGANIAGRVAQRLGLTTLDHQNLLQRLARHGFSLADIQPSCENEQASRENNWKVDKIGKIISSEILFLAQKNSMLIHSPFAPYLLADISHIPRIQVHTPLVQRARNFAAANSCSESEALQKITANDAQSSWILETAFGVENPNRPDNFDLVADTGWLSPQDWAEQILDLAQDPDFLPTANSKTKLRALATRNAARVFDLHCGTDPCQTSATLGR